MSRPANRISSTFTASLAAVACATLLGAGIARAATPQGGARVSIWTPASYSLGNTSYLPAPAIIPVGISTALDGSGDAMEELTVIGRRMPHSALTTPYSYTPQSIFNIGGDPTQRPSGCAQAYTTVAGQPGSAADLANAVGTRSCYF